MLTAILAGAAVALSFAAGLLAARSLRDEPPPAADADEPIRVELSGALTLGGVQLVDGEPLELRLPGERWLTGELRRNGDGWPVFWFEAGGAWEHQVNGAALRRPRLAARVPLDASFRRPAE
ncbi:MAG: hypothetical protein H6739_07790 [Alphaproteobacteria bacterium]|nr:hypothetical protein [Alphaproteobacteria bacterium]